MSAPEPGADRATFGTAGERPYLERLRPASRRPPRRRTGRLRTSVVIALDLAGIAGLVWTARLIWMPLAWGLASIACIGLAWILDTEC